MKEKRNMGMTDFPSFKEIMEKYRTPRKGEEKLSWLRHIYRYLGVLITKLLLPTRITPNQVSFFALFIGIIGALLLLPSSYLLKLLGILLIQSSFALDFADGALARAKGLTSTGGDYLDRTVNAIVAAIVFLCLGLTNYPRFGLWIVVLGFSAAISSLFIKFCFAIKLTSVVNLEKETLRQVLNLLGDKTISKDVIFKSSTSSRMIKHEFLRRLINRIEYAIWNYIYTLNYLTLFVLLKLDFLILIFYGIIFPFYALFVYLRLYKIDSQETINWIIDPNRY